MTESVVVKLRMDQRLKNNVEEICSQMGMSLNTAIMIFVKTLERERKIPFEISADPDPFYHPVNIEYINRKLADYDAGILKIDSHDLIEED